MTTPSTQALIARLDGRIRHHPHCSSFRKGECDCDRDGLYADLVALLSAQEAESSRLAGEVARLVQDVERNVYRAEVYATVLNRRPDESVNEHALRIAGDVAAQEARPSTEANLRAMLAENHRLLDENRQLSAAQEALEQQAADSREVERQHAFAAGYRRAQGYQNVVMTPKCQDAYADYAYRSSPRPATEPP